MLPLVPFIILPNVARLSIHHWLQLSVTTHMQSMSTERPQCGRLHITLTNVMLTQRKRLAVGSRLPSFTTKSGSPRSLQRAAPLVHYKERLPSFTAKSGFPRSLQIAAPLVRYNELLPLFPRSPWSALFSERGEPLFSSAHVFFYFLNYRNKLCCC